MRVYRPRTLQNGFDHPFVLLSTSLFQNRRTLPSPALPAKRCGATSVCIVCMLAAIESRSLSRYFGAGEIDDEIADRMLPTEFVARSGGGRAKPTTGVAPCRSSDCREPRACYVGHRSSVTDSRNNVPTDPHPPRCARHPLPQCGRGALASLRCRRTSLPPEDAGGAHGQGQRAESRMPPPAPRTGRKMSR